MGTIDCSCSHTAEPSTSRTHSCREPSETGMTCPRKSFRPRPSTHLCQGPPDCSNQKQTLFFFSLSLFFFFFFFFRCWPFIRWQNNQHDDCGRFTGRKRRLFCDISTQEACTVTRKLDLEQMCERSIYAYWGLDQTSMAHTEKHKCDQTHFLLQEFPTAGYCLRLKLLDSNNFTRFHFHCWQVLLLLWCGQPPSIKQELIGDYAALGGGGGGGVRPTKKKKKKKKSRQRVSVHLIWSRLSGYTNPATVAVPEDYIFISCACCLF